MATVTNHSQVPVTVNTGKGGDDSAATIKVGETKSVSFDANDPYNKGLIHAGAISVEGHKAASTSAPRKAAAKGSRKTSVPSTPKAEEPKATET
jgi:hypothetical protein